MNNINYNQNYNIYNKNKNIFNINYNKNHNIYITIIILLILILLIIIKIIICRIQIIIFIILIIILNLSGQSFYSNNNDNNNNNKNNNNNCYYIVFHFSSLQSLQTQPHGSPIPRGVYRTQVQVKGDPGRKIRNQRASLQTRLPGFCSFTMPHQTNLIFFTTGSADLGEWVCSQMLESTTSPYPTKLCNSQ